MFATITAASSACKFGIVFMKVKGFRALQTFEELGFAYVDIGQPVPP